MTLVFFFFIVNILIQLTLLVRQWYTLALTQTTLTTTTTFSNYNENLIQHPESDFAEGLQIKHEKVNYYELVLYVEHIKNPSPIIGFILGKAIILFGRFLSALMDLSKRVFFTLIIMSQISLGAIEGI